ncbi:MAG: DUF6152 family protein [Bryobacteraceae bacterium]
MKSQHLAILVAASGLLASTVPLMAHHSFAAEYDSNQPITLKGVVKELRWANPHAYIFIEVKNEAGKTDTWALEMLSPNALARQGWNRESLKVGEVVTVDAYKARDPKPLKDGSLHGNSRSVTLANGSKVFVGSSGDVDSSTATGK